MPTVFVWLDEADTPHQWRGHETRAAAEYEAIQRGRGVMDVQEMDVIEWGRLNSSLCLANNPAEHLRFLQFVNGAGRLAYRNDGFYNVSGFRWERADLWRDGVKSALLPGYAVEFYTALDEVGHWWARIVFDTQHKTLPTRVTVTTEVNDPDADTVRIEDVARRVQSLILGDLTKSGLFR